MKLADHMGHRLRQKLRLAAFASAALCILCSLANATSRELVVAAGMFQNGLDLTKLECVTIRWAVIYGKSYNSQVIKLLEGKLAPTVMPEAQGNCPFIFYSTVLHHKTRAVKHYGQVALVFMSFGTCRKGSDGKVGNNPCVYKNVYLFQDNLLPLELFEVGFKAFLRKQETEWALMKIRLGPDTE